MNPLLQFAIISVLAVLLDATLFTAYVVRLPITLLRVPIFTLWFPLVLWVKFLHCLFVQPRLLRAWTSPSLWASHIEVYLSAILGAYVGLPITRWTR